MSNVLIHQPEYIPWIHLFEKIKMCDTFVILDGVQYNRRSFQNRNQIKTKEGKKWLTIPTKYAERSELISNIEIDNSQKWQDDHLNIIKKNYSQSQFFTSFYDKFKNILNKKYSKLSLLNIDLIKAICVLLDINCNFILHSEMNIKNKKSNLILDICLELNTKKYITGYGSKNYLQIQDFKKNNIDIHFLSPTKEEYRQLFPEMNFIENLSVIDKIFNEGYNI